MGGRGDVMVCVRGMVRRMRAGTAVVRYPPFSSCLCAPPPPLLLQHPGFDFSGAEFTGGGAVPDPRTFMRDLEGRQQ